MKTILKTTLALACSMMLCHAVAAQNLCTGTFSSLYYNTEGGDLLGEEIRIVETDDGFQAAMQFAQGSVGPLLLARVTCEDTRLVIEIPEHDGMPASKFSGTVSKNQLAGIILYKNGQKEKLVLPRHRSYWD